MYQRKRSDSAVTTQKSHAQNSGYDHLKSSHDLVDRACSLILVIVTTCELKMYVFCKVYTFPDLRRDERRQSSNCGGASIEHLHFAKFKYIKFTGIEVVVPTARSSRGRAV